MRLAALAIVTLAMLALSGCIPLTMNPLYGPDDTPILDRKMLGQWRQQDGASVTTWTFLEEEGTDRYLIRGASDDSTAQFRGTLIQLGSWRYLDLAPTGHEPEINANFGIHTIRGHSFWRVIVEDNRLRLLFPDLKQIGDLLEKEPTAIAHIWVPMDDTPVAPDGDRMLYITAPTPELQAFVRDRLTDAFYKEELVLERADAGATQPEPAAAQ